MNKKQAQAVERAIRAADLAMTEKLSLLDAAERVGASRRCTTDAYLVVASGTEEEIRALRTTLNLGLISDQIRQRLPKSERSRRAPILPESEIYRRAFESEIWDNLSKGIMGITSLPKATEVAKIVRRHPSRSKHTNDNILAVHNWITEFLDAWTR